MAHRDQVTGLEARGFARLDEVERALAEEDLDTAAAALAEAREALGPEDPDLLYFEASLNWEREGPAAAADRLRRALAGAPDFADAHYALGLACEQLDDHRGMVAAFLETLRLDTRDDEAAGLGHPEQLAFIEARALEVIDAIPERFAAMLAEVPVVLEPRPHVDLVAEGFDPRALGLFEGEERGASRVASEELSLGLMPRRIVLFTQNLLAAFEDEVELAEEIEVTILHELGHFLGLDEDGVAELGLA